MHKPTWSLLLAFSLITILALTACGGAAPESNAPDTSDVPATSDTAEPSSDEQTDQNVSAGEESEPTDEPEAEPVAEPTEAPTEEEAAAISFANDVNPILQSRCARCHGIDRIEAELVMLSYAELMAGGESGPVIIAGDVENSYLAEMILTQKMPKRGPKLTPIQTQTIIDWISQGALNN
jgi:mono/diheme cytochrome c family protein